MDGMMTPDQILVSPPGADEQRGGPVRRSKRSVAFGETAPAAAGAGDASDLAQLGGLLSKAASTSRAGSTPGVASPIPLPPRPQSAQSGTRTSTSKSAVTDTDAASTPLTPESCRPDEGRRSTGGRTPQMPTPPPGPVRKHRGHSGKGKERPSIIAHRLKQRAAEEMAQCRTGDSRRKSMRAYATGEDVDQEAASAYQQWGDYTVALKPKKAVHRTRAESKLMVLVKPDDDGVSFREHVRLNCNRDCETIEADDEAPPVPTSIASIAGKHPHTCRVNVHGTNTTIDAEMALETDALATKLVIEFYDVQHKVQLNLNATVFLGQEAIKADERRRVEVEEREAEREELLEVWRKNEEVREAAQKRSAKEEGHRRGELDRLRAEFERLRAREAQRERELVELQDRDQQREKEREREREAERAHEKLRAAEREQIRFREREREQERAREKMRDKERQEEAAARDLEVEQIALERQIREEERIEEREREAQRRAEVHQDKMRDVHWREELQRALKMQQVCMVCEKRCRDEELAETERRVAAFRKAECERAASEQAQVARIDAALTQSADEISLAVPDRAAATHYPSNSELPSALFPSGVEVVLPPFGHAHIHVEITHGYYEGDALGILEDGKPASHGERGLRLLPGDNCRLLEDPRTFNNHIGALHDGEAYYPGSHGALRVTCPNDASAVRSVLHALSFRTASKEVGERRVAVVLLVELSAGKATRLVKKTLQEVVHVVPEMFSCTRSHSVAPKERAKGSVPLLLDPRFALPRRAEDGGGGAEAHAAFPHEVVVELWQQEDGFDPLLITYGPWDDKDAPAGGTKAARRAQAKHERESASHFKNGGVYYQGARVAHVDKGLRGDPRERRVRLVFSAPARVDVLQHVLGRLYARPGEEEQTTKTCWVTATSPCAPVGGGSSAGVWYTGSPVQLTFVAAESKARLTVTDPNVSYRFSQHRWPVAEASVATWLPLFKTAQLRTEDWVEKGEASKEYVQGGFIETLIVAGSKKGDELAFLPPASSADAKHGVVLMPNNAIYRHDVRIATLDPPGLLGAKCCKVQFTDDTSLSLEDLEALLQCVQYRTVQQDPSVVGARSVGTYITLGNKTLEGQVTIHLALPTVTAPEQMRAFEETHPDKPLNITEDLDGGDEAQGYANMKIELRVVEGDQNCILDVGCGANDEMTFRNTSRAELFLEEGVIVSDSESQDWSHMRLLSTSANADFAALVHTRPGGLLVRFRRNPEDASAAQSSPSAMSVQMESVRSRESLAHSSDMMSGDFKDSASTHSSSNQSPAAGHKFGSRNSVTSRSSIASSQQTLGGRGGSKPAGKRSGGAASPQRAGNARRTGAAAAADRTAAAARANFLKDDFKAVLQRIYHMSDPENPPPPGCDSVKILVTVTDSLGGESVVLREVKVARRSLPSFSFTQKHLPFHQQCGQYSARQWAKLVALGAEHPYADQLRGGADPHGLEMYPGSPGYASGGYGSGGFNAGSAQSSVNQIVFGRSVCINTDLVLEVNDAWKLSAEIVAGKDTRDALAAVVFEPDENIAIHENGRVLVDGTLVAVLYTKGAKLLVDFNQVATRSNLRSIIRSLAFVSESDTMLNGERRVAVCFQQRGLEPCTQVVTIDVQNPIIGGPEEIGVVYAVNSGYHHVLGRTNIGIPQEELVRHGRVSVQFVGDASVGDELGLYLDPKLWRRDGADEVWSTGASGARRRVCKVASTRQSLTLDFAADGEAAGQATGGDIRELLAGLYYAHWSDSPGRRMRRLNVLVGAGGSLQAMTVSVAIEPVADTIAVVLQKTALDFLLRGDPLPLTPAVRVLLPSGDRLNGQCHLVASFLSGFHQFDVLSFNLPKAFPSRTKTGAVRTCDRGQLYYLTPSGREMKVGTIQKEKTSVKGIGVRLESPPIKAIEGLLQTIQYTCSRPNLKDRGQERQVQFVLRSPYYDSQRIVMTVRLVGPILDAASCHPRKYSGAPVSLLPNVQVSRDCFETGRFDAELTDMNGALMLMPEDALVVLIPEDETDVYLQEDPDDETSFAVLSKVQGGKAVAKARGVNTERLAIDFFGALPRQATTIIRSVCYRMLEEPGDEGAQPYVSVAVKVALTDEYRNKCEGVVHVDS